MSDAEHKGGRPSKGTPADRRLATNKPGGSKPAKPAPKPAFPGAAAPFKPAKSPKPKKG